MLQMNFVSYTRKTARTNVGNAEIRKTRKYVIMIRNKYIYDFWKTIFYFALSAVQLHMPETFATWEEQRNNFAFDEEKEKCV